MSGINLIKKSKAKGKGKGPLFTKGETIWNQMPGKNRSDSSPMNSLLIKALISLLLLFLAQYGLNEFLKLEKQKYQNKIEGINSEIIVQEEKLKEVQIFVDQANSFDAQMKEIKYKISVIEDVAKKRNTMIRLLDFAIRELPESVWLQSIKSVNVLHDYQDGMALENEDEDSIGEVEIIGYATKLQLVSQFMSRLEGGIFYPNWILKESIKPEQEEENGLPDTAKRFTIFAKVIKAND